MNIQNKDTYYNSIYVAIVVNSADNDPSDSNKVQLYIPSIHYRLESIYKEYIQLSDKNSSKFSDQFPWAVTLISNLEVGDIVYGSYINNSNNSFIVIGKDEANSTKKGIGSDDSNINTGGLLNLALPIILENEIGLNREYWPDKIPDEKFKSVTPNDNGDGWSIGLIQWHAGRAFSLLVDIAKSLSDWKSCFSDTNLQLCLDIQSYIDGNVSVRNNYIIKDKNGNFIGPYIPNNNAVKQSIINLLWKGKDIQKAKASEDTENSIKSLQNTYKISNPALIIFMADIMNQYGSGVDNAPKQYPHLVGCISKDLKECNDKPNKSNIEQLKDFVENYWYKRTSYAKDRRTKTYSYILELDKQGKLSTLGDISSYFVKGFVKRTTAPSKTDYWYKHGIGNAGYSMWDNGGNCTYYAWARASEILGRKYDGATGDGVDYGKEDGKYKTGDKPRQGAIITWSKGSAAGHVAIVEDVSEDGNTIWTSESGWRSFLFKYKERKKGSDGNWGAGSSYKFQNFKYII